MDENIADESNVTKLGINRCKINATINQSNLLNDDQGFKISSIFREFKLLYQNQYNRSIHNKLKFMFCCVYPIYLLALYNSSAVQGDLFVLGILFGSVEVLGTVVGERIIQMLPDWLGAILSITCILVSSVLLKIPGIGQTAIYLIFLVQIFFCGAANNVVYLIQESRTINPKILAISLEVNLCFANLASFLAPMVGKMSEPYPTMMFVLCCFGAITIILLVGPLRTDAQE